MKRTRDIRHVRFRKCHKVVLIIGALGLVGCDDSPTTPFSTISQCQQTYQYSAAQCRSIYGQAVDRAKIDGKQYRSRQDCVDDNRNEADKYQRCQYTVHGSSPHYFYVPKYYSYRPGSYAQPFYRSRNSSEFTSATGKSFTSKSGGFKSTSVRGGFGRSVSSHASFGG